LGFVGALLRGENSKLAAFWCPAPGKILRFYLFCTLGLWDFGSHADSMELNVTFTSFIRFTDLEFCQNLYVEFQLGLRSINGFIRLFSCDFFTMD